MFKAVMDSTKAWKQIVDAIATMLTEAQFVANESGLSLRQMDSSKAAMVDIFLPDKIFQEYHCDDEQKICLGVDELSRTSKRMSADDKLEFSVNEAEKRFYIRMIGQAERLFKLPMLTPPPDQPKKPSSELDVKAEMHSEGFKQAVKDISVVSSYVKISADATTLVFTGEGDTGEAEVSLKVGEESDLFDLKSKGPSTAMYALSYLSEITKAISGDTLVLRFSSSRPLILESEIAEGGRLTFVLAPRVERR
ncbi:MAG: proliferating cell nuclear antigen (pcna) [Candidatus Thorarchaeota archaeon]|nr:proliferating cell nuclear antigen (pcna) [Candidatus Thorarchaeota archaeon]